jgi:hypothetical protein
VGSAYFVENRRGERAWETALARLAAEGETLDLASLWPGPVLPTENFCATPVLDGLAEVIDGDAEKGEPARKRERLTALDPSRRGHTKPPSLSRGGVNWTAWREYLAQAGVFTVPKDEPDPAKAVFEALESNRKLFDDLAGAAATHRKAQFTPPPGRRLHSQSNDTVRLDLPHLTPVHSLARAVALRARARLGFAVGAVSVHTLADVRTLCRLRDACNGDGLLVAYLVAESIQKSASDIIYEGIVARSWDGSALSTLQAELAAHEHEKRVTDAMRLELGLVASFLDRDPQRLAEEFNVGSTPATALVSLLSPEGWKRQHQATYITLHLDHILRPLKSQGSAGLLAHKELLSTQLPRGLNAAVPRLALTICSGVADAAAFSEIDRLQLLTACALERFFLEHQHYPEGLEELRPAFVPQVPVDLDGRPLRYERDQANGRYRLWSVGLNLVDDWHGRLPPAPPPSGSEPQATGRRASDWLLAFPVSP